MCKSAPLIFAVAFMTPKMFMDGNVLYGSVGLTAMIIYFVWAVVEMIIMQRELSHMKREMLKSLDDMMAEIEKRAKVKVRKVKKETVNEQA